MEEARLLMPVPDPIPHGCVGACLGTSEADEWRVSDPARYCDWVIGAQDAAGCAAAAGATAEAPTVSGAWRIWADSNNVLWSTGIEYERLMALLRRASTLLRSEGLTAEEALAAYKDLKNAQITSAEWNTDGDVYACVPDLTPAALGQLATVAWAVAHALAIRSVTDLPARAGLWRSLARALQAAQESNADDDFPAASAVLHAAAVHAECEALRQSGLAHFDACRAGAARACISRALERARAEHQADDRIVCARRVVELQRDFDRTHSVAQRVEGGLATGRVIDATLLCELVVLPIV
jgi:hypothetical protein